MFLSRYIDMDKVKITNRENRKVHIFKVKDKDNLSPKEVKKICDKMGVHSLFVEGKYYE